MLLALLIVGSLDNDDDGETDVKDCFPFGPVQRSDCKERLAGEMSQNMSQGSLMSNAYGEERDIQDGEVECHAQSDGSDKEWIAPDGQP